MITSFYVRVKILIINIKVNIDYAVLLLKTTTSSPSEIIKTLKSLITEDRTLGLLP